MPHEPVATAPLPSSQEQMRLGVIAAVAVVPAGAAAYAGFEALGIFDDMTRYQGAYGNHHGGEATVAAVFAHVNASVLAAVVLGLALTVYLRFVLHRDLGRSATLPATRLSLLAACLGGVPAAVLYAAESGALESLAGVARPGAGSVMEASARLTLLLRVAAASGVAVALVGMVAALLARRSPRRIAASPGPWMAIGAWLLALAIAFSMRSFALHDLATRTPTT